MTQRGGAELKPGFGRRRMVLHAWIKVRAQRSIACTVISRTGNRALIAFRSHAPAAHEFRLRLEDCDDEYSCEVYYRRPSILGVRLTEK